MKAHELLADKNKWTQGALARSGNESPTDAASPYACKWCAMGAIYHCYGDTLSCWKHITTAGATARGLFKSPLTLVNDELGYEAVMHVLTTADV